MKNKKLIIGLSVLLVVALITTGCEKKEIAVKNGSKVAVSIKGDKFTATEYYEKIKEDNISKLIDMIDSSLLSKKKYKTDEKEEQEYIDNQVNQIKSIYGEDEESYKSILKQYFGAESEEELKEKLSLQYKRNEAVKTYVKDNIKDDEIKKYYEENVYGEVKASHILVAVNVDSDATEEEKQEAEQKALEKAKKIITQLEKGKKFETLAKKYSDDKATATNGGDLGYFDLEDMVKDFSDALKELKKDEYTKEPVKTEYGYHVILKTGEKAKPKLKEVKDDIKEKIRDKKLEDSNTLYYETLKAIREDNKLSWNDDVLKQAYEKYMNDLIDQAKSS